jgi:hypothetical protein
LQMLLWGEATETSKAMSAAAAAAAAAAAGMPRCG